MARMYLPFANEGVMVAIVAPERADDALLAMRSVATGRGAAVVGEVVDEHPGLVAMTTYMGGRRVVDLLPGDQLPRIC